VTRSAQDDVFVARSDTKSQRLLGLLTQTLKP
jgi:hypothetical protein